MVDFGMLTLIVKTPISQNRILNFGKIKYHQISIDKNNIEQLVDLKWNIIVIWECEIKKKSLESLIEEVANCILTKTSR